MDDRARQSRRKLRGLGRTREAEHAKWNIWSETREKDRSEIQQGEIERGEIERSEIQEKELLRGRMRREESAQASRRGKEGSESRVAATRTLQSICKYD